MNHGLNCFVKNGSKMRRKRAAKTIFFTMLALCMTFGLSSCGGTAKETKENQIKDDIVEALSKDAALSGYNLDVNSFSVSKRQTNTEDKTDFVWCEVAATGNVIRNSDVKFSCSIECEVTYGLYNDGWRLDTCTCNIVTSSIKPLSYPTKEQAERLARSDYGDIPDDRFEVHDMIQKSDTEVVYPVDIYYSERGYNYGATKQKELTFNFNIEEGWWYIGQRANKYYIS